MVRRTIALVFAAGLTVACSDLAALTQAPAGDVHAMGFGGGPAPSPSASPQHSHDWYMTTWSNTYDNPQLRTQPNYKDNLKQAIPLYQEATREYPTEPWFFIFLSFAYHETGDYADCLPPAETAFALNTTNDPGINANVKVACQYVLYYLKDNQDLVLRADALLVKLDPRNTDLADRLFFQLVKAGRDADARSEVLATTTDPAFGQLADGAILTIHHPPSQLASPSPTPTPSASPSARPAKGIFPGPFLPSPFPTRYLPHVPDVIVKLITGGPKQLDDAANTLNSYRGYHFAGSTYDALLSPTLSYADMMASPYHDKEVDYEHKAVAAYFAANPFTQQGTFTSPLHGSFYVGQGAGGASLHFGLGAHYAYDLVPNTPQVIGTPIYAVAAGKVATVVDGNPNNAPGATVNLNAQANYIVIDHGNGVFSRYVHCNAGSFRYRVGDQVAAGAQIAAVGNSGVTTGPHVHFQFDNNSSDNPITWPVTLTGLTRRAWGSNASFVATDALETGYEYDVR